MAHVYPPTYGSDGTALIQAGIDTAEATIYIHPGLYLISSPGTYTDSNTESDPTALVGISNQTIILMEGAILKAAVGSFKGKYQAMLGWLSKTNCHLRMESGSRIQMRKDHYSASPFDVGAAHPNGQNVNGYYKAEHRHTLKFVGCTNYSVTGANEEHVTTSGGDGIYIGSVIPAGATCTTGTITGIKFSQHYRQACSIISATNLVFNWCEFNNTLGTSPQSGVDLEPNYPSDTLINIVFNNCTFSANPSRNLFFNFVNLDPAVTSPISVTFNKCGFSNGTTNCGLDFKCATGAGPPSGTITFNDCSISNLAYAAICASGYSLACNVIITFNNLQIYETSKLNLDKPLDFTFTDSPSTTGKFQFINDCTIHETQNRKVTQISSTNNATNVTGILRLDRLNRPITTAQYDAKLPNLLIQPYAKDVTFLQKIYARIAHGRRSY